MKNILQIRIIKWKQILLKTFLAIFFLLVIIKPYNLVAKNKKILSLIKIDSSKTMLFNFKANYSKYFSEIFYVEATLFNNTDSTIYFLTYSCNGTQYLLQHDTDKFLLTPQINCNTTLPIKIKLKPKDTFTFNGYFKNKTGEKDIKLGFRLMLVDNTFNIIKYRNLRNLKEKICKSEVIWMEKLIE